jgi:1-acyl-sn-glycerol-3-phosphate acyltransferase
MTIFTHLKAILLVTFGLLIAVITCFAVIPFPLKTRLKVVCPMWAWVLNLVVRHGFEMRLDIREDQRSPELKTIPANGVYIANHQSYADIPLLSSVYQVPPIMKKEIMYIPFIGLLGWICGALPVSRSSHNSRKKVFAQTRHRLKEEKIGIQVYPEGTRSKDALPKDFDSIKRTLIVFAFNEGIPVIPTSIYGTRGVFSKNGKINPGRHVGIIVHKEIRPENFANSDEFCRACWEKVREGHDQMKQKLAPLNGNLSLVGSLPG